MSTTNQPTTLGLAVSICLLLAFASILAIISNRPSTNATTTNANITFVVNPDLALYLSDKEINIGNIYPTPNGSVSSVPTTVRIISNNTYGYNLLLNSIDPNGGASGNMIGQDTGSTIAPMPGTIDNPIPFDSSNCNSWGFSTPREDNNYSSAFDSSYTTYTNTPTATAIGNFAGIPTTPTTIHQNINQAIASIDDTITYYYASCIQSSIIPDTYTAKVRWTAISEEVPPIIPPTLAQNGDFIQTVTNATCPTTRTWVVDARDNRTYWIRKIPGTGAGGTSDLCWMETNLAYAGGGTWNSGMDWTDDRVSLTAMNTGGANPWNTMPPVNGTPFVRTNVPQPSGTQLFTQCTGSTPFTTSNCTLPTTGTGNASGANGAQRGFLYNWCATMGGQSSACNNTETNQANINPAINVCPAGWRLPTGEPTIGEFTLLNNAINNGLTNNSIGLRNEWLAVYSGMLDLSAGNLPNVNSIGSYWSSTISNANDSRWLGLGANSVASASTTTKSFGLSVRCVR